MKSLRFIYQDDEFVEKGNQFNLKYKKLRSSKEEYDKFIAQNSSPGKWKEFKIMFLKFTPKCPICEQQLDNYDDIDHFRPKNFYWWLAYDYKNYVINCSLCNRSMKKAKFPLLNEENKVTFDTKNRILKEKPLLFNPLDDNPEELFQLNFKIINGKESLLIEPLESLEEDSYEFKKAIKTIEVFKLNDKENISRLNLMINNSASLSTLVEMRELYLRKRDDFSRDLFFRSIKKTLGGMKNGLAILVLKGQFKWFLS